MTVIKLFSFFFIFIFFLQFAEAQKIDLDKRAVKIEYTDLPSNGELAKFNTYSVEFNANSATLLQIGLNNTVIDNHFFLEGFSYLSANSDFLYSIKIESPQTIKESIEEIKSEVTNKDNSKSTIISYRGIVKLAVPTTLLINKNGDGTNIYNKTFATTSTPVTFQTQDFDTREKAQALINTKENSINTYAKKIYIELLKEEVNKLKQTYTFRKVQTSDIFWEIDLKKAPEQAAFNDQLTKAATLLEKISYKESLGGIRQEMLPILNYWFESAAAIQATDKKQKKLKYGHLINLAKSQYRLELLDECEKTAQLIIDNDYDKIDGRMMQSYASDLREEMKKVNISSRHLSRPGFDSEARFTLGAPVVVANSTGFKGIKEEIKDIKKIATDIKKISEKRVLTDSLSWRDSYFATVKFLYNGELIECKTGKLREGLCIQYYFNNTNRHEIDKEHFTISLRKENSLFLKDGEFTDLSINLFTNKKVSKAFDADSLVALLNQYKNIPLTDIYTNTNDSVPFRDGNNNYIAPKMIYLKDYRKKLSVDANISFHNKGRDNTMYKTDNGDQFSIEVIEKRPVKLKEREAGMKSQAYMVRMKIPEIKMSRMSPVHTTYSKSYDYVTIKNVEFYILMISHFQNQNDNHLPDSQRK